MDQSVQQSEEIPSKVHSQEIRLTVYWVWLKHLLIQVGYPVEYFGCQSKTTSFHRCFSSVSIIDVGLFNIPKVYI